MLVAVEEIVDEVKLKDRMEVVVVVVVLEYEDFVDVDSEHL